MSQKDQPETTPTIVEVKDTPEPKLGKFAAFRAKHPRLTKALAITGGLLVVGAGAYAAGSSKSSKDNSDSETSYDDGFDGTVQVTDSASEV